ncbi:hypothetical protein [Streptomyces sp. CS014]|uniref:hypothetical protein n=1 Tax=Streptomyces sp. CS014 TaxID=2162707 RepID=UPI000D506E08|nr:hypothetical protein [Streptomyces sp. CS014]PVD04509.1 hypothetical protein DBP12_03535 [Streptomyces sp. CS014]
MLITEARHLFAGADILDGLTHRKVIAVNPTRGNYEKVRITFAQGGDFCPGRQIVAEPQQEFLATTTYAISWIIHSRSKSAKTTQDRARISPVGALKGHWAFRFPWVVVDRLEEEHTVHTSRLISMCQLPGEGEPTPPPVTEKGVRYYSFFRGGPAVLSTGDDVRRRWSELETIHYREHGQSVTDEHGVTNRQPAAYPVRDCLRCCPGPLDLQLFEHTIERTSRDVQLEDLPTDWDYSLTGAMAHARINAYIEKENAK